MLEQSRPPSQLIVIDSSDDHQATVDVVKDSVREFPIDLTILPSERGLTLQRNASLPLIKHPVVFFPDDDSIWFPGVAAAQMEVYVRDEAGRIAAVCAAESSSPPPDWELEVASSYQMNWKHRLQQKIAATRVKVESRFFPDPALLLGKSFWPPASELPHWLAEEDVVVVPWMTGFRMSFRTEVIRQVRFDENLTRYSLFEDIDASFGAWQLGWVVGARKARVYHYRSPEKRDQGRRLGAQQLLNKAYVIHKHSPLGHPARERMNAFARYKVFQYRMGAMDSFGRERYEGAVAARAAIKTISSSNISNRAESYLDALG
jgi:glycosyltransferase involved in cell wall biosynthesis